MVKVVGKIYILPTPYLLKGAIYCPQKRLFHPYLSWEKSPLAGDFSLIGRLILVLAEVKSLKQKK